MAYGLKYFTYVFEELPAKISAEFRIPTDPAHLYIGGLSMGGYGAMKCVATAPEKYAGCIALSSCFYPMDRSLWRNDVAGSEQDEWKAILGPELPFGDENDIEKLTEKALAAGKKLPKLYMACGTEDGLLRMSRKLHDFFLTNDIPCSYEEWSGIHDWWFWDTGIQKGLAQMFPGE